MKRQIIRFKGNAENYSVIIGKNILKILPKKIEILCLRSKENCSNYR